MKRLIYGLKARKEAEVNYAATIVNAFPKALRHDVEAVVDTLPLDRNKVYFSDEHIYQVKLENEFLAIPYRLYLDEPNIQRESNLTATQKVILHCIYLRHHNGYVRQRRLEQLLTQDNYWVTPFTLQLLGEYVFEILEVLNQHINDRTINNYKRFIKENPTYWQLTESRMVSYWNEYYRRQFPSLENYLGQQLVDRIKK